MRPSGQFSQFGQWLTDFPLNDGIAASPPWFDMGIGIGPDVGASPPVMFPSSVAAAPAPAVAGFTESTDNFVTNLNTGAAAVSDPNSALLVSNATTFTSGTATATSASDLDALIRAADFKPPPEP